MVHTASVICALANRPMTFVNKTTRITSKMIGIIVSELIVGGLVFLFFG